MKMVKFFFFAKERTCRICTSFLSLVHSSRCDRCAGWRIGVQKTSWANEDKDDDAGGHNNGGAADNSDAGDNGAAGDNGGGGDNDGGGNGGGGDNGGGDVKPENTLHKYGFNME